MTKRLGLFSLSVLLLAACERPQPGPQPVPSETASAVLPPAPIESTAPAPEAAAPVDAKAPEEPPAPKPLFRITEGISTPESVLWDEAGDRYLVSNVNGKPTDADNNGTILELSPEGKVSKEKFIAGGVNNAKLDAPKGSGISGGVLYVTDITVVRRFDAKTGAPKGDIPIPGSSFLNDIAVAKDGRVFVSDSGINASFEPTGAGGAVHVIDKSGKVKTIAKSPELNGANGLLWRENDKDLLVVSLLSNELYKLDDKGARKDITQLPEGMLDGIAPLGEELLISSWKGSGVYRGKLGGKFERVLAGLKGPADIGYDAKRGRLLVPRFQESAVEIYEIK